MRIDVDAWDPSYGTALVTPGAMAGPASGSNAEVTCDVEVPAAAWRPVSAPANVLAPSVVLLVDGVRRVDAQIWITSDDGTTHAGIAASIAAGVVRCDLRRGVADIAVTRIERGLFTPSAAAIDLVAGAVTYAVRPVAHDDPSDLTLAVQRDLAALETTVSSAARRGSGAVPAASCAVSGETVSAVCGETVSEPDDLLVVDGPLHGRTHMPRTLGYVKTHRVEYLPQRLAPVIAHLQPWQRCPVFGLGGTNWHRYTWYLRLPGPAGSPWAGVVRVECSGDLTAAEAIALADQSAVTLPRFASSPYKDPRAPQNLVPIAGLERRLRATLGDARLLYRALTASAARAATRAGTERR